MGMSVLAQERKYGLIVSVRAFRRHGVRTSGNDDTLAVWQATLQPILIYGADRAALSRALERALARNVTPAVYTEDMFKTTHDAANREVVRTVIRAELNLVGLAMRAERKVIDKIVDGLKFHS